MASARKTATNENVSTYGGVSRDYTSLSTWESATDNNLVSAAQSEVLECYDDQASFDDSVSISGATTNASYFRIIRPAGVKGEASWQGHDGTPNNGVHFIDTTIEDIIEIDEDYCQVQDLIAEHNGNASPGTRRVFKIDNGTDPDQAAFVGCIAIGDGNAGSSDINCFELQPDNSEGFVIDCIAIRATGKNFDCDAGGGTVRFYNCTAIDGETENFDRSDGTAIAINCLSEGSLGNDFDGTWDAASDYNASSDTTAPGSNSRISQTFTFVNAGNDDYHLDENDAGALGYGTDLSSDADYAFDDDIDWDVRPATWDIGFDQFVASGPANINDINGITAANINDINGVLYADIVDVNGVD